MELILDGLDNSAGRLKSVLPLFREMSFYTPVTRLKQEQGAHLGSLLATLFL